jgi:hypothetical protein
MNARAAAIAEGWFDWFGYWYFLDPVRFVEEVARPFYFRGTARELCLAQGIEFHDEQAKL